MSLWRALTVLALTGAVALSPGTRAVAQDCDRLPTSAKRPRACNPQEECLKQLPKTLTGAAREAATKDCQRQPTAGVCYGPDTYDPQAECRQGKKR